MEIILEMVETLHLMEEEMGAALPLKEEIINQEVQGGSMDYIQELEMEAMEIIHQMELEMVEDLEEIILRMLEVKEITGPMAQDHQMALSATKDKMEVATGHPKVDLEHLMARTIMAKDLPVAIGHHKEDLV